MMAQVHKPVAANAIKGFQGTLNQKNSALKPTRTSKRTRKAVTYADATSDLDTQPAPAKKRKNQNSPAESLTTGLNAVQPAKSGADVGTVSAKPAGKSVKQPPKSTERRLRRYRERQTQDYLQLRERALTQRMYVIDRVRGGSIEHPTETVKLAGSTGNVYTITIDNQPTCNCPHARKGKQCKHVVYVLTRVLRAPADLEHQLALLTSELREIFEKAPPIPAADAGEGENDGKRKPVEGDCPICCMEFHPKTEKIIYCKAACGNNIHSECFQQWAATKNGATVTCPFCRTPWQGDEDMLGSVASSGAMNSEGYVNVGSQLGLPRERDYSTYNPFWVRRQMREGNIEHDDEFVTDFNHQRDERFGRGFDWSSYYAERRNDRDASDDAEE